ncbi:MULTISPECIES: hybrid sensor histidine kinase/response regulator [Aerosakkonema]|uniref:hybrid sensor histidine kinase/response regulator n=1 Tax=Aerosakkonema TaxID=1246629 RepID=UPI0035B71FBA
MTEERESKGKILIVDDTLDNINLLANMLTDSGYKVRKALNGQMALMGVQASPPDLILLDINMPEINGYEVCKKLKSDDKNREIPVIFLSAFDDVLDKVKAFSVGGVDYITKPFQFQEVLARVETHLTIQRLQNKLAEQNALLQKSSALEREKSQQLEQALHQLQQTQAQLIQSEKMSSLGQTVAGIAHEINNPINFIYGNLRYINECSYQMLQLIQLYQQILPNPSTDIQQLQESLDIEFLAEDFPKLLASMKAGSERIRDIVLSLRNFSRLGEAELKPVDIHEGLDSTLMILQHRLNEQSNSPAITVVKAYGTLPFVECYAGLINQVFMNILNNAIDSLESRFANDALLEGSTEQLNPSPTISICTQIKEGDRVIIRIGDNGTGMTEAIQKKAFDPFFTTKKLGVRTGLGLSIAYQIVVEHHGGEIFCESVLGEGTQFMIEIPLRQQLQKVG